MQVAPSGKWATELRTAIVCTSPHHGNTRRIAEAIAATLGADLFTPEQALVASLASYDLVGFGSGIYFGRHHRTLRQLIDAAPALPRAAFLFSTAGLPWLSRLFHRSLRRRLERRGCRIVGEFCCPGWDTVGPLVLIGGLNRRRPNERDIEFAKEFAQSLEASCDATGGRDICGTAR
jgi:flavodoxin